MRVMLVSPRDFGGGAERVAWMLFKGLQERGHACSLAVGIKSSRDPGVHEICNGRGYDPVRRALWRVERGLLRRDNRIRGAWRLSRLTRLLVEPGSILDAYRGTEDFRYPGTWHLLDAPFSNVEVAHLHNLHGDYFDLRSLPWLSHRVPTVVTLHDMWAITGLCTYSLSCERWTSGCGDCPLFRSRPSLLPAICRKDGSRANWLRKKQIYSKSRLCVVTPSEWLMDMVERSMLAPAAAYKCVIPYGVDFSVFRPGDSLKAKELAGISKGLRVLLAVANGILRNPLKGFAMIREAAEMLAASRPDWNVLLLAVGADARERKAGNLTVRFVPFVRDPGVLARFYQAADVYLHAALQDNFPNTVLEALACGIPVVATAVGGVPEQVCATSVPGMPHVAAPYSHSHESERPTGVLVPPGDSGAMARAVAWLLEGDSMRQRIGSNAAEAARRRFGPDRQLDSYLQIYQRMKLAPFSG